MKSKISYGSLLIWICCMQNLIISCKGGRINRVISVNPAFKVKAVNLGGWLVTEGWIEPSLFDGIPNKDLLDGTQIQLKSVKIGKYVSAENGGGTILVANRTSASGWETFKLWRINETTFNFRVFSNQFAGLQQDSGSSSAVVAEAESPALSETFQIVRKSDDAFRVRIQASNGLFLQAKTQDLVTADYAGDGGWGDDNPSVFELTIVRTLRGEYQVTNGYGPAKAPKIMQEHWSTFIVEDDFRFISENSINAVRIPVGWWIASDPTPPKPFVGGSLEALDNAFNWAQKYSIQVIVDLHAAPGSQNGNEHSGTRDGSIEWGKADTIQQSVDVIDFLASRYASNPNLYAIELINEPLAPEVSLNSLKRYYQLAYDSVRKHSSTAYVIMSNRLGPAEPKELFPLASKLQLTVIDVHYYNLYSSIFDSMSVQQNIDFINNNRSSDLSYITTSNGPLTFVGEWVAEWQVSKATKEDYQKFANAQLQVYGGASFGWAYWTLKNVNNHWSLEWMIQNGYISLSS